MILSELYTNSNEFVISFEVFPPKGEGQEYKEKINELFKELDKLKKYNPQLISVTYGAGGSTREKTFDLVLKIKNNFNIITMPHFTCVNFNKEEILEYIKKIEAEGIKNILALRGDPPKGTSTFIKPKNGFSHANELVSFIKKHTNLSIGVAGYPEKHPEAIDSKSDLLNLQRKTKAGADVIYTQMFFNNNDFLKFQDELIKLNVNIPIIPGIMILQNITQIEKIIKLSGSKLPTEFEKILYLNQDNPDYIKKLGIEYATQQIQQLKTYGVKGVHLYILNKAYAASQILDNLK